MRIYLSFRHENEDLDRSARARRRCGPGGAARRTSAVDDPAAAAG